MLLNEVKLAGNIGKDAEMRYTPQQIPVASFSVAYTDKAKDGTEKVYWFDVVCFGKTAEMAAEYKKGDNVMIVGKLEQQTWEDKTTGQKRHAIKVVAFLIAKIERTQNAEFPYKTNKLPPIQPQVVTKKTTASFNQEAFEDIPF